jgi:hypothetical protein
VIWKGCVRGIELFQGAGNRARGESAWAGARAVGGLRCG